MQKILLTLLTCVLSITLFAQSFGDRLDLNPELAPFYHGVASGDPLTDRVIIWTRVTTDLETVDGVWRIATDSLFTENVQTGSFTTDASKDFTVKVDVTGLQANTYYFYDFQAVDARSLIGRTKTAPTGDVEQYRVVWVSCADITTGYYNVYQRIAERNDFDVLYHLGDYIYEYHNERYMNSGLKIRDVEPVNEIISLADYRTRYAFYRLDPKLAGLHQQYPWVILWDDHETANDSYKDGAQNHQPFNEGPWEDRKAAGVQAFLEWMPIRENPVNPVDISRTFTIGNLVEFYAPESRLLHRSEINAISVLFPNNDPSNRGMIGKDRRMELTDRLLNTTAQWKILVSPTVFGPLYYTAIVRNGDAWDGFPWERRQITKFVRDNDIRNFGVISGDIHMAHAMDLPWNSDRPQNANTYNPETGEGSIGFNFVGSGVSSGSCCRTGRFDDWKNRNPHLKYSNFRKSGYSLLDVTKEKVTCDYYYIDSVQLEDDNSHYWEASWCMFDSTKHLVDCGQASTYNGEYFPFAPSTVGVYDSTVTSYQTNVGEILSVYPVPANEFVGMQFFLQKRMEITVRVYDMAGKVVVRNYAGTLDRGVHIENTMINKLSKGSYILAVEDENGNSIATRKIVKQ